MIPAIALPIILTVVFVVWALVTCRDGMSTLPGGLKGMDIACRLIIAAIASLAAWAGWGLYVYIFLVPRIQ